MNLKSRALSLIAAMGLALGLAGGVSADVSNATLVGSGINCSAAATGTVNFGTYTFNGTVYTATLPASQTFNLLLLTLNPTQRCDIAVSATNLTFSTNNIAVSALSLDATPGGNAIATLSGTGQQLFANKTTGTFPVLTAISTSALNTLPTGLYVGTITFTGSIAP